MVHDFLGKEVSRNKQVNTLEFKVVNLDLPNKTGVDADLNTKFDLVHDGTWPVYFEVDIGEVKDIGRISLFNYNIESMMLSVQQMDDNGSWIMG